MSKNPDLIAPKMVSRRTFLRGTAGITFAIGSTGLLVACGQAAATIDGVSANPELEASIWVSIYPDNTIKIMYPGAEMGQGTMTAIPLILAEELDADWETVTVETVAVHDTAYGNPFFNNILYTGGSAAVMAYFDVMRTAGVQVRKLLVEAASAHWGVPASEISTQLSVVTHKGSGQSLSYGNIAEFAQIPDEMPSVEPSEFKRRDEYRYLGKDITRIDVPSKTDGSAEYGMDVQVPGMAFAAVLRAPVEGESPIKVDAEKAEGVAGIRRIVKLPHGVAVVADTVEATRKAKSLLNVEWSNTSPFRNADSNRMLQEYADRASDLAEDGATWSEQGDIRTAFAEADQIFAAMYVSEAAYHAQMEPLNATASVTEDGKAAEIWVGTQSQSLTILGASQLLETTPDKIVLHPLLLGGGYGRRTELRQKYVDDALMISREVGIPIKVIWSREDDVKDGTFRPMAAQQVRAAIDENGQITAWQHRVATPSILAFMNPPRWERVKDRDVISMLGAENSNKYDIPNFLAEHVMTDRASRVCAWRGVATSYTKFAAESFVDELALIRGADPLQFRLELAKDNKQLVGVLNAVSRMAEWSRERTRTSLGVAVTGYHKSLTATIVELSVDRDSGKVDVEKVWVAVDVGLSLAPRNIRAQIEGNIIYGLSAALKENISIERGMVQQSNFHDYPVMRITEVPQIEVEILDFPGPPSGVGELGLATVAPAIANAIWKATGVRIRKLPITPDVVLSALDA